MNVRQANSTGFTPKTEDLLRLEKHQQEKKRKYTSKDTSSEMLYHPRNQHMILVKSILTMGL